MCGGNSLDLPRERARESAVLPRTWLGRVGAALALAVVAGGLYVAGRLNDDQPVAFDDVEAHFKYGSTGGERGWKSQFGFGIPYWMWVALPELFPEYLPDRAPGRGYSSLGLLYEPGRDPRFDLPIGLSMRRVQGIDRVYFTCSVCHAGSVRTAPEAPHAIVLGMPANTVNFGGLAQFLKRSAADERFQASAVLSQIDAMAALRRRAYAGNAAYRPAEFGWVDTQLFRQVGVAMMRGTLNELMGKLSFVDFTTWGPGRVDTFGPPKALLGFRMETAPAREKIGVSDFPSVWNQRARKGMSLHWDGNNCSVDERNLSAAYGTGATPASLDRPSLFRIADYLWDTAAPPGFPADRIDLALVPEGARVYREYCRTCHGEGASPFRAAGDGSTVGQVTPIAEIGTDPARLDSYTRELAVSQNTLYAGFPADEEACRAYAESACRPDQDEAEFLALRDRCYPSRFTHFRKTSGYANQPLDGLWLRAPYLHNGSVPSLRALLEPSAMRPAQFHIGYDVYDFGNVGFVSAGPGAEREGWLLDTRKPGNGNRGHEGPAFGTQLPPHVKNALLEYLKTF